MNMLRCKKILAAMIGILILLSFVALCLLIGWSHFAPRVKVIAYQSANFGEHSATDGRNIYYIHNNGIYRANMDMSNPSLLVEGKGITLLSVDNGNLAYSQNDRKDEEGISYSQIVRVILLDNPKIELLKQEMDTCNRIFVSGSRLYIYGLDTQLKRIREDGYGEWGVYFCDIQQNTELQLVTNDMCQRPSLLYEYLMYEDENICWYYENQGLNNDNAIYSRKQNQRITSMNTWKNVSKPVRGGLLILDKNQLNLITENEEQTLLTLPIPQDGVKGADPRFTGWLNFPNNQQLFVAQRYRNWISTTGGPKDTDHLYDLVYLVDNDYQLLTTFQTAKGEHIIYADPDQLIVLKGREVSVIHNYLTSDNRKHLCTISSYSGTLTVEVCGTNIMFFQNGKLIESIAI